MCYFGGGNRIGAGVCDGAGDAHDHVEESGIAALDGWRGGWEQGGGDVGEEGGEEVGVGEGGVREAVAELE